MSGAGAKEQEKKTMSKLHLTRRDVMKLAAAVFPLSALKAAGPGPVMATLGDYMSQAASRALPADAVEKTKHHILDTLAAMISGTVLPPGRVAMQYARVHPGEKSATVAGTNLLCSPVDAALANGVLAHSDETDDSHAPSHSHPGCAVVPAALAAGEQFGVTGSRLLR